MPEREDEAGAAPGLLQELQFERLDGHRRGLEELDRPDIAELPGLVPRLQQEIGKEQVVNYRLIRVDTQAEDKQKVLEDRGIETMREHQWKQGHQRRRHAGVQCPLEVASGCCGAAKGFEDDGLLQRLGPGG